MGWDNERFANSTVLPADGTIDLGTSAKPFDDVYADRFHGDGAAVTAVDHGNCAGRSDDDHTQYHTDARGDVRYNTKAQITTISGDIVAQIPTDYISDSEMTTISGDIRTATVTKINPTSTNGGMILNQYVSEPWGKIGWTLSPTTTSGQCNGLVVPFAIPTGGPVPEMGQLVSVDVNRKAFSTDFVNYADRPCIGMSMGQNPSWASDYLGDLTASTAIYVLVKGGTYARGDINVSAAKGKPIYVDPTVSGAYTATKPTTDGQTIQVVGFGTGSSLGLYIDPVMHLETVGQYDTRYYTEAEIATISGDITAQLTFLDLTDTPDSYTDQSNKYVMVSGTQLVFATVSGGAGTDHATLANLAYADAGHTGFLSSAQFATSSGDIVAQFPTDFYSQAEIATISGDIIAQIPDTDDYATDAEVTVISGDIIAQIPTDYISDAEMTTISGDIVGQIPSLAGYLTTAQFTTSSGDIINQIPSDYISDAEMTTISGDIVGQIPSLSGYVTDGEMTTISGDIVAQIPTVAGVTGWFDDGNNYRVYVVNGLITAISGSTDGGYNVE